MPMPGWCVNIKSAVASIEAKSHEPEEVVQAGLGRHQRPKEGRWLPEVRQILSLKKQKRLPQMRAGSESCPHDQGSKGFSRAPQAITPPGRGRQTH
jgi:hypothetical protein